MPGACSGLAQRPVTPVSSGEVGSTIVVATPSDALEQVLAGGLYVSKKPSGHTAGEAGLEDCGLVDGTGRKALVGPATPPPRPWGRSQSWTARR